MESNYTNIEQLIGGLKHEDARNLRISKIFQGVMAVMTPLYFIFFLIIFLEEEKLLKSLGFLFFSLGFLVFALIFRKLYKEYKSIDYGVPTIEMLSKAAQRYKFWQRKTRLVLIPAILVSIGVGFSLQDAIPLPDIRQRFLVIVTGYAITLFIAFMVGYWKWRVRQKPLRDKALALLKEFEA